MNRNFTGGRSGSLALWAGAALLAGLCVTLGGCDVNDVKHKGVRCGVDGATLWLQPGGTFEQDYTYLDYSLTDPGASNQQMLRGAHTGHWELLLPGSGSPDGKPYVFFQGVYPGDSGPSIPGLGTEDTVSVPAGDIVGLRKVLSPAQALELALAGVKLKDQ